MSKPVEIIETGEVCHSVADAARLLRVSISAVIQCLKGRSKRVAGCRVRYAPVPMYRPPRPHGPRRIVFDTAGKWYASYSDIARVHGLTPAKARTLTLKNGGVFPVPHHNDLFGPL